ncbi:Protein of unknown function [Gryllus bimaculatus]|nr:Protein of unknown function [Gryllus bimaculatus]
MQQNILLGSSNQFKVAYKNDFVEHEGMQKKYANSSNSLTRRIPRIMLKTGKTLKVMEFKAQKIYYELSHPAFEVKVYSVERK